MSIERLYLVWNADKGLIADLRYTLKKLGGTTECSLCDLTHGWLTETPEWKACKREFAVPIVGLYRDKLSADEARIVAGDLPCVIAETDHGLVKLMTAADIEAAEGDVERFTASLREAMVARVA